MIKPIDKTLVKEIQKRIDLKTKPLGSLGQLEKIALKISLVQNTLNPKISKPHIIVFAADHGLAKEGVSAFPQEVTHQMVLNFINGGAAINVFCRQHNISLKVADAGVNHDFGEIKGLINSKVGMGTASSLNQKAMSMEHVKKSIDLGKKMVETQVDPECNIIGFGEMGIGNTSSSALIMHYVTKIDLDICIGKGTGLDSDKLDTKKNILNNVLKYHGSKEDPYEILSAVGGYEIAQMTGAFLKSAELGKVIIVDGFIATAAFSIASLIDPNVKDYAIFSHQSDEKGHADFVKFLDGEVLLNLGLRLGEGTGAALAFPLIQSSVNFFNEMASFEDANVSNN